MNIKTLGIDLSKHVFQLHGIDAIGKPVLKKKIITRKIANSKNQLRGRNIDKEVESEFHQGTN